MNDSLSTVKLLTPFAERLLVRLAPKYTDHGKLIVMGPLPPDISNEPKPPRLEPYRRELELGDVIHFKHDKGFGHIDTEDGQLFFHASGYRSPSIHEYIDEGKVRHTVQLERLPKSSSGSLPKPAPVRGEGILYLRGTRESAEGVKHLAQFWTFAKPFQQFMEQQQAVHDAAMERWVRLAKYRLTLRVRTQPDPGPNYDSIGAVYTSILFDGTETAMLQDWYQYFQHELQLNEHRQVVLSCAEYDESLGQHGPYVECEPEVTEDFLG